LGTVAEFSKHHCPQLIEKNGGREGIRTPDPLLAKQVLCQLSYTPTVQIYFNSQALAASLSKTMSVDFSTFGTTILSHPRILPADCRRPSAKTSMSLSTPPSKS
jgi:hypothetical protein